MKSLCSLPIGILLLIGSVTTSNAWLVTGHVFCDANGNGAIDDGDVPRPGALVEVSNTSGTFSNSTYTGTPAGDFLITLPDTPDTYVVSVNPFNLPSDATFAIPAGGLYTFTLNGDPDTNFTGDFLISSADCTITNPPPPPPPPPPVTNGCCLTGSGTIAAGQCKGITFSGKAAPACGCATGDFGSWDVVASALKLHFQGEVLEIMNCGVTDSGCKFIEFQGAGTLKGTGGNKANCGLVYFFVHAEDCGSCSGTADRLYFRAYAADGTTLFLISGDAANPLNVVPITISSGDLKIGTSCCDQEGDKGHGDKGKDKDHGGKGDCNKGNGNGDKGKGDCGKGDKGDKGKDKGKGNGSNGKDKGGKDCQDTNKNAKDKAKDKK
jgi:hypothetical protein